ncbi:bifunctional diaminohydroxyphosphoribosylaminopyrimidine deaminase/5-amino-6-(5-phosphoribosylamino)uracil reductase RibD [Qipengyuania spongiae]|uniref:Riboflavin biosynthesis protein RibD n=1 Tax=Qipengyuania spongiae TaxID=2909673 RepID=A0ABY5SY64_9SPHN|nr:bifunctional diaminohydroxyphosphoribosylaminopyrimidine deaminase/5-amino-6-(5-phosphoribosylamino)uracil reductase RibD [Qipengyuania spongiae]UVI39473.1 bifunctional diaminohydroxyphosphoribosylaminopyrimidine deaminase/5-amino-6-(5-phosphoribosylamino)uracil reductase RibD [Qipengyuania spongiae]
MAGATPIPADADWLAAAARLATRARPLSRPNPGVGALVIKDDIVVGRGWTMPGGRPHAEAIALAQAGEAARGADIFVTLEPCAHRSTRGPACADLLVEAGPARVIAGCEDPDPRTAGQGIARLRAAGIDARIADHPPSWASLAGYLTRARDGRPHVTLKLAMSLDGRIALPDGQSRWITGEIARAHVHSRRALSDAILVGGKTWRADAPALDVRLPGIEDRSPQRIVLTRGPAPQGTLAIASPDRIGTLADVLYLYVEGGAGAAASFLAVDLVDRLEIYRAPILIGDGLPAIGDIGLGNLSAAHERWGLAERRQLGSDTFEAYERQREE